MKKILLITFLLASTLAYSQSKSVERYRQANEPGLTLFFYKNTLKMYARISLKLDEMGEDVPDLMEMIKGIEKVKFYNYTPNNASFSPSSFNQLKKEVEAENYESMMDARTNGARLNILMRERRGTPEAFVVFVESADGYSILDIDGAPDLTNLVKFSEILTSDMESFNMVRDAFN